MICAAKEVLVGSIKSMGRSMACLWWAPHGQVCRQFGAQNRARAKAEMSGQTARAGII